MAGLMVSMDLKITTFADIEKWRCVLALSLIHIYFDLACAAELIERGILEFKAELVRDNLAAGEDLSLIHI